MVKMYTLDLGGDWVLVNELLNLCKELGLEKIKVSGDNVMFACP